MYHSHPESGTGDSYLFQRSSRRTSYIYLVYRNLADAMIFQFRFARSLATLRKRSSVFSMFSSIKAKYHPLITITINVDALFMHTYMFTNWTYKNLNPLFDGKELRLRRSMPSYQPTVTTSEDLEALVKQIPLIGKEYAGGSLAKFRNIGFR